MIQSRLYAGADLGAAYFGRGLMRQIDNQTDAAIADYTEAIKLNSDLYNAYAQRGGQYLVKNELANAEKDIETAIEKSPGKVSAFGLALKAELRRKQGKLQEANDHVTKALELQKDLEYAKLVHKSSEEDIKRQQACVKPPPPPQPPRREDPTDALRERAFAELRKGDNYGARTIQ